MSAPSKVIEPEAIGYWPTMARSRLVLPTPLRPSTHVTLPGSADDRDAAQRLGRAVIEADVFDLQASLYRPRYTSITRSFDET